MTSISVDLHKFGYTAKGASVIVHRDRALRRHQIFVTDNWLGGVYGSSGVLGTKSGGAMAAAWAVLHHLGDDGYLRLAAATARAATEELAAGVRPPTPRWCSAPSPTTTLLAFGAADPDRLDVFAVADALWRTGLVRGSPGPSAVAPLHGERGPRGRIADFLADLGSAVAEVTQDGVRGDRGAYGTVE